MFEELCFNSEDCANTCRYEGFHLGGKCWGLFRTCYCKKKCR